MAHVPVVVTTIPAITKVRVAVAAVLNIVTIIARVVGAVGAPAMVRVTMRLLRRVADAAALKLITA